MLQNPKSYLIGFIVFALFIKCTPTRFVKPLEKGKFAASGNLGGPLIKFSGSTIPIPLTSVAAGYGIDSTLTVFAGLHTTSLAFGVLQADLGVLKQIRQQKGFIPAISVAPIANFMVDKWESKFSFYPQLDLNAYWKYKMRPHYFYVGLSNWFELRGKRSEGDDQKTRWLPLLQTGHTFVFRKWSYTLEFKYRNTINNPVIVDYVGLGNGSALGVYFGVTKKF